MIPTRKNLFYPKQSAGTARKADFVIFFAYCTFFKKRISYCNKTT
jgi:hypothetical protein